MLTLAELTTIVRLARNGRFDLGDLMALGRARASEQAAKAAKKKASPSPSASPATGAKDSDPKKEGQAGSAEAEAAQPGAIQTDVEAKPHAAPSQTAEASHGAAPAPDSALAVGDEDTAKAALEKSHEKAVAKLAEAMADIIKVQEAMQKVPVLGKAIVTLQAKIRLLIFKTLGHVPLIGPVLVKIGSAAQAKLKIMVIAKGLRRAAKQFGIPLAQVADVAKKLAAQDEYLDDALEQLLCPAAAMAGGKAVKNEKGNTGGGLTGLVLQQVRERGPSACREWLLFCMVELLEVDLMQAEQFVKKLTLKALIALGQEILQGGFPFLACTKLAKLNVDVITFDVPAAAVSDGISDDQLAFDFKEPPVVVGVSEDWANKLANETDSQAPGKFDKLAFVGSRPAGSFTKEELQQELAEAKGADVSLKLRFKRGLDIDFAERFQEVLPSVLRRLLGVPLDEGKLLARNLTMDHMQRLVFILLNGGLKKLNDLALELSVEVNFQQAFRAHIPSLVVRKFGFSLRGAGCIIFPS
ncbi:unnamed protein product [Polarella glacialis]|uniref:Uncharacterized protein n=1 Tax=Polarella glacialis TaxID=89957 RepID=A0A813GB93_POLGL|nr:unnamed protein product [Polarella glacialis]